MVLKRVPDRLCLKFAWMPHGTGTHHLPSKLPKLGVEYPNGIDVAGAKERLHRASKAYARLEVVQIFCVVTHLHDARLVDTPNADILKVLLIDLTLTRFLNDLVLLTRKQRPKNMCLRLRLCRRAKSEVDIMFLR